MRNTGAITFVNCDLIDNSSRCCSVMYSPSGTVILVNCFIAGNSNGAGHGIIWIEGDLEASNCVFTGNTIGASSSARGGALYLVGNGSTALITNCTFSANKAGLSGGRGGGIYVGSAMGAVTVANSVFWGNEDSTGSGEGAQIYFEGSPPTVDYCCIQGLTGGLGGTGNIGDDPLFDDPDGQDNIAGTEDDDLRLLPSSPCIDAADNDVVPADTFDLDGDEDFGEPIPVDLDGSWRFVDDPGTADTGNGTPPIVDMGAYEYSP